VPVRESAALNEADVCNAVLDGNCWEEEFLALCWDVFEGTEFDWNALDRYILEGFEIGTFVEAVFDGGCLERFD
jgi:hypothetical protein